MLSNETSRRETKRTLSTQGIRPESAKKTRRRETSAAWWARIKSDPEALIAWLLDQYRGEQLAAGRLLALRERFGTTGRTHVIIGVIAEQERTHSEWLAGLLLARGVSARLVPKEERYWPCVLPGITNLETAAAVGAHAEHMRLSRIATIAHDEDAPTDIREVFRRILPQE